MSLNVSQHATVVIGGSIAGLYAAYLLAKSGKEVHLFDENHIEQAHPRTLIATAQLIDTLGFSPSEAIVNHIHTIELFSPGHNLKVALSQPDLVVERATMIRMLAHMAMQAGVKIWHGFRFEQLSADGNGAALQLISKADKKHFELKTHSLIGADGAFSKVADAAGLNGLVRVPLLQAVVEVPAHTDAGNVQVWFEPELTPYFFWLIPEGHRRAVIGFIADQGNTAKNTLMNFLQAHSFTPIEMQAARIPLFNSGHRPWRKINDCDVYLVGDAAGHVKVTTVGGLVTGLWGAKAAAEAVIERRPYVGKLKPLQRELWLHNGIRRVLNRLSTRDYDTLLQTINTPTHHLLGRYSRDELRRMGLKLILAQPRLLRFLPHALLRS